MMTSNTTPIRMVAEKGYVLTNGDAYSTEGGYIKDGDDFIPLGGYITLGVNDSSDNWYEITVEEAEKRQAPAEEEVI